MPADSPKTPSDFDREAEMRGFTYMYDLVGKFRKDHAHISQSI
jgi:hypothetical protein